MSNRSSPGWYRWRGVLSCLVLIGVWQAAAIAIGKSLFLPRVESVVRVLFSRNWMADIPRDATASVLRVTAGYCIAVILGVSLAVLLDRLPGARAWAEPWLAFFRYVPTVALLPLLILWLGIDEMTKVTLIALGVVFHVAVGVLFALQNVPRGVVELAEMLRFSRGKRYWRVIVPAALPDILDVCRIALGWAWTYVVLAEIVAGDAGLGFMVRNGLRFIRPEVAFAGVLVIGLLGILSDAAMRLALRNLFPWHGRAAIES